MVLEYKNYNIKKQGGQEKMEKIYNIGLDIGTSSVGYAVTDLRNNLIKSFLIFGLFFEKKSNDTETLRPIYSSNPLTEAFIPTIFEI